MSLSVEHLEELRDLLHHFSRTVKTDALFARVIHSKKIVMKEIELLEMPPVNVNEEQLTTKEK